MRVFIVDADQILNYSYSSTTFFDGYDVPGELLLNATFLDAPIRNITSLTEHTCALRAGVVRYPVQISNRTITSQSLS